MKKGYWIAFADVTDPERYAQYQGFVRPFLAENGGRFVIRGGRQDIVEGQSRGRTVVVEFPSYEQALEAYHSAAYQSGMRDRVISAVTDLIVVEGHED